MVQLLREYYELCEGGVCQDLLTESEKTFVRNGGMMLTGKLQESDVQNGNGRVYPHAIMEREVKKYKALVDDRRALGELDHDVALGGARRAHQQQRLLDRGAERHQLQLCLTPDEETVEQPPVLQDAVADVVYLGLELI